MGTRISFDELRRIKHELPEGAIRQIAEKLDLNVETVRNYFGGTNYDKGEACGFHYEPGPDGGIVELDDTTILDMAKAMLKEQNPTQDSGCGASCASC